ncbi:hypothetical protein J0B03_03415 [Alkalibacter rhizosphaerae]|uniref:Uncharacterized protein n=1 Tax=Alkalibacter rhizosphaerae TaxID=2815577 RepID=A0A975AJ23_9FIRM|nr:hypothetical protein [Alkalibacter rhizosphaerae]QSX09130.1 hypothetical protein J0B03_03415 [Alkalibacter rhizosphaerae]
MGKYENNKEALLEDLDFLTKYIREESAKGHFITYEDFLLKPLSFEEEDMELLLEELKSNVDYIQIKEVQGKETRYFYSTEKMNEQYASLLLRTKEKDFLQLIADTVRDDSKRYPKTTNIKKFLGSPYHLTTEELDAVLAQMEKDDAYQDIKKTKASNGAVCLYSDKHLVKARAEYLTEYEEVTRYEYQ